MSCQDLLPIVIGYIRISGEGLFSRDFDFEGAVSRSSIRKKNKLNKHNHQ